MSSSRQTTIACDVKGCTASTQHDGTRAQARKAARALGWKTSPEKDMCPVHALGVRLDPPPGVKARHGRRSRPLDPLKTREALIAELGHEPLLTLVIKRSRSNYRAVRAAYAVAGLDTKRGQAETRSARVARVRAAIANDPGATDGQIARRCQASLSFVERARKSRKVPGAQSRRAALILATRVELISEMGDVEPTQRQVADRAGVAASTVRAVYRRFGLSTTLGAKSRREAARRRSAEAQELLEAGSSVSAVAQALGMSESWVRKHGEPVLGRIWAPGWLKAEGLAPCVDLGQPRRVLEEPDVGEVGELAGYGLAVEYPRPVAVPGA